MQQWLLISYQKVVNFFKETIINLGFVISQSFKILIIVTTILLLPIWLMTMPISTYVQLDLTVNRLSFKVNEHSLQLEKIPFHAVNLTDFQQVSFTDSNNAAISIKSKGSELLPSVLLETANPTTTEFGMLQQLTIETPAKVTLATENSKAESENLTIAIEGMKNIPTVYLLHSQAFYLTSEQCDVQGMDSSKIESLSRRKPFVTVQGKNDKLTMKFDVSTQEPLLIFRHDAGEETISVRELEFLLEDIENGERVTETTLLAEGTISYPEYPEIEPVTFKESNFLLLDKMDDFNVEQIKFDPKTHELKLRISGLATKPVITHPVSFSTLQKDYRLTVVETLGQGSKFIEVTLNLLIYLIPIVIGLVAIGKVKIVQDKKDESEKV